jgi:hypothetical protein
MVVTGMVGVPVIGVLGMVLVMMLLRLVRVWVRVLVLVLVMMVTTRVMRRSTAALMVLIVGTVIVVGARMIRLIR